PEQIRGELNIGPPADIYSLGATLYHMVTGNVPFDGKNPSAVMHKHLKAELVAPDHVNQKLSSGISEVIEMMMAKNPRDRYQNCRDLISDLKAVKSGGHPPMAHREIAPIEFATLAHAEASAPSVIMKDTSRKPNTVSAKLFIIMVVVLAASLVFNLVLISLH
ncbi:MAG: serine/threonine protein kinase, partial [Pyrinomonadaceae bacterium]|nr:serine/threonine protein kinase [Phycisphaerales bacterium]